MELDKLFKKDAFKNIDKGFMSSLEKLSKDIKGKDFNETLDLIIKFSENMPKNKNISEEEKEAMINAILESLSADERNRFKTVLEMLGWWKYIRVKKLNIHNYRKVFFNIYFFESLFFNAVLFLN